MGTAVGERRHAAREGRKKWPQPSQTGSEAEARGVPSVKATNHLDTAGLNVKVNARMRITAVPSRVSCGGAAWGNLTACAAARETPNF